jgi:hypothetical protein
VTNSTISHTKYLSFHDTIALNPKTENMNPSKTAPVPEHNYLSTAEYAQIVGIALSQGEIDLIESVAAKICAFGSIATVQAFDTREQVTAYPVTVFGGAF